jgi:hypothetical protein
MSEIKPLFLENGNLRQMSSGFTIDPGMLNGSTVGRFNSQNSYKAGDIVINDIGQGPAFYEAKENLYPKAFFSGDWAPVGTAITGAQGNQGIDGTPGVDAKFLVVTSDSHVFRFGSDGSIEGPEIIEVTANIQNLGSGTLTWTALGSGTDGAGIVDLFPSSGPSCTLTGGGAKLIIPDSFFSKFIDDNSPLQVSDPVLTLQAAQGNFQDTFRILKLKDGENALTGFLSNSNHSTSTGEKDYVDSNGDGVADTPFLSGDPLLSAGGDYKVYRGFLELTPQNSDITYEVGTITPLGGASVQIDSNGIYTIDSISAETVTVLFKATVLGETVEKAYTHSTTFQGRDGTSILSGAAAPTNADGLLGDFWLDTSAVVLYGPKGTASVAEVEVTSVNTSDGNWLFHNPTDFEGTYIKSGTVHSRDAWTNGTKWITWKPFTVEVGTWALRDSNSESANNAVGSEFGQTSIGDLVAALATPMSTNGHVLSGSYGQDAWQTPGISLTGAGVDTDGDGLVDAMVANGYLGHNRTIDRSLSCAATVNGLMIGEVTIAEPSVFTVAEGGIIIIVGEQIGSAITPESLGEFLHPLAVSGSWGDLADKPASFWPEAHNHSVQNITGLQATLTELQRVALQNRVIVSDQPPPLPGSPEDDTKVGDVWVQWVAT